MSSRVPGLVVVLSGRWQALLLTVASAVGCRRWVYRNVYPWSRWWRWRRLEPIRRAGGKCEHCGRRMSGPDVHHLPAGYRRLGRERARDLRAVCRRCHRGGALH